MVMAQTAKPVELRPQTVEAFRAYIQSAEAKIKQTLGSGDLFLWSDGNPEIAHQISAGQIAAQFWSGQGPVKVPYGLVHDWVAAGFIVGTTVKDVLAVIQDYDNYRKSTNPRSLPQNGSAITTVTFKST